MGARFAGSQRLGDRRRRRLAVETDEVAGNPSPRRGLSAPPESARALDPADVDEGTALRHPSFDFTVTCAIPSAWWKYVVGGMGCLATGGSLVVAGSYASELGAALGPEIKRIFTFPDAPVARWFSSLLLSASAQLAVFLWWARSRSQTDFDGRYRLWLRIAFAWMVFGGCVATGAHAAVISALRNLLPEISARTATFGWLIPLLVAAIAILLSLAREMHDCRWSHSLLWLTAVAYLISAGCLLVTGDVIAAEVRLVFQHAAFLGGHISLFLSMWLHARHVMYCTPEPAKPVKSRWRIPRPHFRLPRHARHRNPEQPGQPADQQPVQRKRSINSSPEGTSAEPASNRIETDRLRAEQPEGTSTPRFRHDGPRQIRTADAGEMETHSTTDDTHPPEFATETDPQSNGDSDAKLGAESAQPAAIENEAGQNPTPLDLRGLSKKQRRRLMQEFREREREARR